MSGIAYAYDAPTPAPSDGYLFGAVKRLLWDLPTKSTVLDMGCGNGAFLSLFHNRGWRCFGTDFSPSGIAVAQRAFPDVDFFLANSETAADIILSHSGPVDAIISTEVIEHVYSPRDFFRTAYSVLKPGGSLVVTTPYHGYLKNLILAITGKLDPHFTVLWDYGHIKFWSRKTLTHIANEAGFEVIEFTGAGGLPYIWKSMAMLMRKPLDASEPHVPDSDSLR